MRLQHFKEYFSAARVNRYLAATGNSSTRAIKLYKANLRVSQSFHPLLGILEVVLRNRINETLAAHFSDPDWIINQKTGFMVDPSLTYLHKKTGQIRTNNFLLREIKKAETRLHGLKTPVTSGKIIAEQTFGFWTDLFEAHYYRILKGKQIKIFNHLPAGHGRKQVNEELDKIRRFRNRINHNEPICFTGTTIDFTQTLEVYQSICNTLSWVDPQLLKLIKDLDKVNKNVTSALKI